MRAVFQQTGIIPLLQMHDALECSVTSREQAEMIARLGEEAVSLNVPMMVDLKFGKTWGDACIMGRTDRRSGAPNRRPQRRSTAPSRRSPSRSSRRSSFHRSRRFSIPLPPRPAIASPRPPPRQPRLTGPPPLDDTEIDLADLVDCQVPRNRMILCPFHGETKPSMRIYPDHYYCFGCGAWGDHVDWLVQVEGLEYDQARDIVDNWDGPVIPRSQTRDAEEDARRTPTR